MENHFVNVCEFGYTHGQCRCMSKDKTIRSVECNNIGHARNPKNEPEYQPKHRREDNDTTDDS